MVCLIFEYTLHSGMPYIFLLFGSPTTKGWRPLQYTVVCRIFFYFLAHLPQKVGDPCNTQWYAVYFFTFWLTYHKRLATPAIHSGMPYIFLLFGSPTTKGWRPLQYTVVCRIFFYFLAHLPQKVGDPCTTQWYAVYFFTFWLTYHKRLATPTIHSGMPYIWVFNQESESYNRVIMALDYQAAFISPTIHIPEIGQERERERERGRQRERGKKDNEKWENNTFF